MSIKVKHCLVIVCDGCGRDPSDFNEEGYTPHFDSIDEATKHLAGDGNDVDFTHQWLMTPAEHVCPQCRGKRACELVGHDWGDWWAGDARGIPMQRRACYRCGESQLAPAEASS